jgi:hypothetical protein
VTRAPSDRDLEVLRGGPDTVKFLTEDHSQ